MSMQTDPRPGGLRRLVDLGFSGVAALGDLALAAMLVVMALEILLRMTGLGSLIIADEASAALLVATTFLGLSIAVRERALFRFDGLHKRIPDRIRPHYERVLTLIALAITLVLMRYLITFVASTHRRGTVSDGMVDYPLWIVQIVMPVGLVFLAFALIEALIRPPKADTKAATHV